MSDFVFGPGDSSDHAEPAAQAVTDLVADVANRTGMNVVTFEIRDQRVLEYLNACGTLTFGEAVSLSVDGPIPWALAPDRKIWGYIRGFDSATRMLEVQPKR